MNKEKLKSIFYKYYLTIKNNKSFLTEIIISLLSFSLFLVLFYYTIFTYFNISQEFYEARYNYNKTKNINYIYKNLTPDIVYKNNKIYFLDKKGNFIYNIKINYKPLKIKNYYILIYKSSIYIGIKLDNIIIFKNIFGNIYMFFKIFSILIYIVLLGNIILIIEIIKNENKRNLLKLASVESLATNNSMIILTENIHHELNTPLSVLENKYYKLKKICEEFLIKNCDANGKNIDDIIKKCNNENIVEFAKKFKDIDYYIKLSIEQIEGILENMRDFKHLRFSNGNKTIYDIIEGSLKILKVSYNKTFKYEIDENFKNYKINHKTKMKNADLINILINHIKNSLEANATTIKIYIQKYEKGFLYFIIEDDGNGVPKNIRDKIYQENVSTKNENNTIGLRGNGMFLNKFLLKQFGGDEILYWTEEGKGTKFLIKIPAIKKD